MNALRTALGGFVVLPVVVLLAACGGDDSSGTSDAVPAATATAPESTTESTPAGATSTPTAPTAPPPTVPPPVPERGFPCDPGGGFPKPSDSCPYGDPVTGSVTAFDGSSLTIKPFHTYYNDAEGEAYAKKHHLRYPFDDDVYDAPDGPPRTLELASDTVCTGIILVGYRNPMADHTVPCTKFAQAVEPTYGIPAALWFDGDRLVQLSELFRP